jgi:predicted TIM-barrel fold metal-dependent hydrolase
MYKESGPEEMRPVGETEFVQGIADQVARGQGMTAVASGIVGFADLTLGSKVAPVLEAHIAASKNRFRGIRHISTWDAHPADIMATQNAPKGMLLDLKFREGFACLQKYGLSFDAWLYFPQLMELVDLARAFPDTAIVMDHIGGLVALTQGRLMTCFTIGSAGLLRSLPAPMCQ